MDRYLILGWPYQHLVKPVFFRFDPEFVHDQVSAIGKLVGKFAPLRKLTTHVLRYQSPKLEQTIAGLRFTNPVGLSAGFDKNAKLLNIMPAVGFGFEEIGSVTLESYAGNAKPRLFRLPKSKALVVYYGLMNQGVAAIAKRIKQALTGDMLVGISVAKTNCTRTADTAAGIADYYKCLEYLETEQIGDYYTLNISCPNTFGGEPFTTPERLQPLLTQIDLLQITKPLFVKLPINLQLPEFAQLLDIIYLHRVTGVIIGNLTKVHDPALIKDSIPSYVKGGISGMPTQQLSNELISLAYQKYGQNLIIVGVGGIFSAADAYEKIKRGASLVQLITGMIYQGPQLIGQINRDLVKLLAADGYKNIAQAVGSYYR